MRASLKLAAIATAGHAPPALQLQALFALEDSPHVELRRRRDLIESAFLGRLVQAPAEKAGRMPKALAGLELVVGDLTHQLRTDRHPLEVLSPRPAAEPARHSAGAVQIPVALRNVDLQRRQFGDQLLALGGTERRGVTDVLETALAGIQTEEQPAH